MWKLDDIVTYGSAGVCRVVDVREEKFCDEYKTYFVLRPVFDDKNTFFVPSFNENLMAKIHPIMTKDEAVSFIRSLDEIEAEWIENDKLRQDTYREYLESGCRERVVSMLKALVNRRDELMVKGKKLRTSDEISLRIGEAVIENEWAYIFGIKRAEVKEFIKGL